MCVCVWGGRGGGVGVQHGNLISSKLYGHCKNSSSYMYLNVCVIKEFLNIRVTCIGICWVMKMEKSHSVWCENEWRTSHVTPCSNIMIIMLVFY